MINLRNIIDKRSWNNIVFIKSSNDVLLMCTSFYFLLKPLFHDVLLHFTRNCQRIFSHKFDIFGNLVMGDVSFAVVENLPCSYLIMLKAFNFYYNDNFLSKLLVWNTNDLSILYSIHFKYIVLYLFRIHILTSSDDHILLSSDYR